MDTAGPLASHTQDAHLPPPPHTPPPQPPPAFMEVTNMILATSLSSNVQLAVQQQLPDLSHTHTRSQWNVPMGVELKAGHHSGVRNVGQDRGQDGSGSVGHDQLTFCKTFIGDRSLQSIPALSVRDGGVVAAQLLSPALLLALA